MAEKKEIPQPRNIFEAININIYSVSQDLHTAMNMILELSKEVAKISTMFNAPVPEQPNAISGNEGIENE